MKIMLESTDRLVEIQAARGVVPARVWEGKTESGIAVVCLVTRVAVREGLAESIYDEFNRELQQTPHKAASEDAIRSFPLRCIL